MYSWNSADLLRLRGRRGGGVVVGSNRVVIASRNIFSISGAPQTFSFFMMEIFMQVGISGGTDGREKIERPINRRLTEGRALPTW